jgi:uncharacterized phage-associated protein
MHLDLFYFCSYGKRMYDARAISNYFLDRAEGKGIGLTVLTLLKILYFAHAWYLTKNKIPLVAQPFEAWKYGPVNRVVYDQFKHYGRRPIEQKAVSFEPKVALFMPTPYHFDPNTQEFLANIFDYYSQFHPYTLSDLTHEKGGPWDMVWQEAEKRAVPGMIISNDAIAAWFATKAGVYGTDRERRIVQ